jgi:hypothetical protein
MPEMRAADLKEGSKDKAKFFRGDELPSAAVKANLTPAPEMPPLQNASH